MNDLTAKHNRATIGILEAYAKKAKTPLSAMTLEALGSPPEDGLLTVSFRPNRSLVIYLVTGHRTWRYEGRKLWTILQ